MRKAMTKACSSITASCATTVLGFLALVFMRFKIGPDLGIVLAKGVLFSLISVIFFLPAVILASNRLIEKTSHRSLLPSFAWLGRFARAIRVPILILALIVTIPLFMAQRSNNFLYGMDQYEQGSREERDRAMITEAFGEQAQMVLLVPKGDREKAALAQGCVIFPRSRRLSRIHRWSVSAFRRICSLRNSATRSFPITTVG